MRLLLNIVLVMVNLTWGGRILSASYGGGQFGLCWTSDDGSRRTTLFYPDAWDVHIDGTVVTLTRTGPNRDEFDQPWHSADKYTLGTPSV